jgi:hypothetical protein
LFEKKSDEFDENENKVPTKEELTYIDAMTFGKVLRKVKNCILSDELVGDDVKLMLGLWLFRKVDMSTSFDSHSRNFSEIGEQLSESLRRVESVIQKCSHIDYSNYDVRTEVCKNIFMNRYTCTDEENAFFLPQMMNDIEFSKCILCTLTPTINISDLVSHFVDWIETAPTFEQKSNLLDVILVNFPDIADQETREKFDTIQSELSFSPDTQSYEKSIYSDNQNVHTSFMNTQTLSILGRLCVDWKIFSTDDYSPEVLAQIGYDPASAEAPRTQPMLLGVGVTPEKMYINLLKNYIKVNLDLNPEGLEMPISELLKAIEERCVIDHTTIFLGEDIEVEEVLRVDFYDEMSDAIKLCASGYIARGLNSLQGFTGGNYSIQISSTDRVKGIVTHNITKALTSLPSGERKDMIIDGSLEEEGEERNIYLSFIRDTINQKVVPDLLLEGGDLNEICEVLKEMTLDSWVVEGNEITYE